MKGKIYSKKKLIGTSELKVTDETMGVVSGIFIPNENYIEIRETIWNFHNLNLDNNFDELNNLRINCQLENGVFLSPIGGFLITDLKELLGEDLKFKAAGNYRHQIEDNFLVYPPKERVFEPWELISIDQKISYEDELFKEIGKRKWNFLKPQKHRLNDYEFNAMAKLSFNDDVLFSIRKKGENKFEYVVIHLTWKGKFEEDDNYPKVEFFKNFDHFLYYRLYPDKRDWEA